MDLALDEVIARRSTLDAEDAPRIVSALHSRGVCLIHLGRFDEALADYDKALQLSPGSIAGFTGRGLTFEKKGDLSRARTEFRKAVDADEEVAGNTLEGVSQPAVPNR